MAGVGNVGINNKARKLKYGWAGINGVCRKLVQGWVGVNGVARTCWTCQIDAGMKVFTSSDVWVAPENMIIDVFCVGGGGGGTLGNSSGGAGGYTTTKRNVRVEKGHEYAVIVGLGGTHRGATPDDYATDGSASSFGVDICIANGGQSAETRKVVNQQGYEVSGWSCGGSGGGQQYGGKGGVDGANGGYNESMGYKDMSSDTTCGGQGNTTRAFGEVNGTLYSTGGDSHHDSAKPTTYPKSGGNNTGDGGESGTYNNVHGGDGGSGIVIIRWETQEV